MQVSATLSALPGVEAAATVMATELNRETLATAGLLVAEAAGAGPNDLVVAVRAADEATADAAMRQAEALLTSRRGTSAGAGQEQPPRSLRSAARRLGGVANLAVISVPGPYAAAEARQALLAGMHVFLFSDNVSIQEEVALKRLGRQRGLLVMGPDCGTAIVNGIGLGFANVVRRGGIGIVGASGTGIQEVTTLLHQAGEGISQAIGTGGRDLHERVGGSTTLHALELLRDDPATEAIVVISKPPSPAVAERVLQAAADTGKPVTACLLGAVQEPPPGVRTAANLAQAVRLIVDGEIADRERWGEAPPPEVKLQPEQRQVRGLYCGGTLAEEAARILADWDHAVIDFGDDRFTRGRAHPMIDPTLRDRAVLEAAEDPRVAVVLLDVILGHGAHPDPGGHLAVVVRQARERARATGREMALFAHVVGTRPDPQGLERQETSLREAGVHLFRTNEGMALAARAVVAKGAA
jgi:succinyl-CoA synthetase alpha subunit